AGGWPRYPFEKSGDRGGELAPVGPLAGQLALSRGGEPVAAAAPPVGDRPGAGDETGVRQPVQCRIDGAGRQVEPAAAAFAQRLLDRVTVPGAVFEGGQQEHVEVPLERL